MSLSCALILLLLATPVWADQSESAEGNRGLNAQWAGQLILDIRLTSFPRLANTNIRVEPFHGHSDYFQARFSILHFLFAKRMQYVIRVNDDPGIQTVPEDAGRAILAHELAHVQYYASGSRIHLLGLIRYNSSSYRREFERRADLEATQLGYAQGLKNYRLWLYQHVSAKALLEKKRDYLSPEEIDAAARALTNPVCLRVDER